MNIDTDIYKDLGLTQPEQPAEKNNELGQDTFLKLMVTQLTNQNPLKPMEGADMLSQMAQFGTVSGIDELNDSFEGLTSSLVSNQALQAAGIVGRDVLIASDQVILAAGGEVAGEIDLPAHTAEARLRIENGNGELVDTVDLGGLAEGLSSFSWDGQLTDGTYADPGEYRVVAEALIDGEYEAVETYIRSQVESVTLGKDGLGMDIDLAGLGKVDFNEISKIL